MTTSYSYGQLRHPGAQLTNRWILVRRAGVYVPGGLAVYSSSVILNIVPDQVSRR